MSWGFKIRITANLLSVIKDIHQKCTANIVTDGEMWEVWSPTLGTRQGGIRKPQRSNNKQRNKNKHWQNSKNVLIAGNKVTYREDSRGRSLNSSDGKRVQQYARWNVHTQKPVPFYALVKKIRKHNRKNTSLRLVT